MAIVYPQDPNQDPYAAPQPTLADRAVAHPVLATLAVLAVALGIGLLINKIRGGSSSSTPTSGSQNGQQVLYVPTSNTFLNYSGGSSGSSNGQMGTIAQGTDAWSKSHPGTPIFPSAAQTGDSGVLGYVPFGSQVQITGPVVTGQANTTSGGQSSSSYYPVSYNGITGYVPAANFSSVGDASSGTGSGGMPTASLSGWFGRHAWQPGETWDGIAAQHGTDWTALYQHNQEAIDTVAPSDVLPWQTTYPGLILNVP